MAGYESSGIYTAKDSGWIVEENGRHILSDKAELRPKYITKIQNRKGYGSSSSLHNGIAHNR